MCQDWQFFVFQIGFNPMLDYLQNLTSRQKNLFVIAYDCGAILFCFLLSQSLRFGEWFPPIFGEPFFLVSLPFVIAIQFAGLYFSNVYRAIWRFSSIPDLVRVIKGATLSVAASLFALFLYNRLDGFPRSAFLIDWLLLVFALGGSRFIYRILSDQKRNRFLLDQNVKNVLINGDGGGRENLLRDIKSTPSLGVRVVGFVDDNKSKTGRILNGIKILGTTENLQKFIDDFNITQVFIAIPSASSQEIRNILSKVSDSKIEIKTLPKINDLIFGQVEYSQLRAIGPEDLLGRTPINLDMEQIAKFIKGKKVLVTGAGGSIGSEICRQVLKYSPELLIGFEQSEFAVYELKKMLSEGNVKIIIGDVRQLDSINLAVSTHKPDIIFHAAAYKHVPLMEENPIEAIKTNVLGTHNTAFSALKNNVAKFVLISTDKAINPTNVMGTTKRLAEMVCQSFDREQKTQFVMIRFGNVLGSSGSVIPLFKEQIARGGPVTVTHPEVTRYFMSIPEACQLVLQAGSMGIHGQVMVLDMGQPVKILELAKEMIKLAGLKPDHDIEIEFTGMRPGEKMYEELFRDDEKRLPTENSKIFISTTVPLPSHFSDPLQELMLLAHNSSREDIILKLKSMVPEYNPLENEADPKEETIKYH
jgi:FlaA1/EpsC-like NDP-sugar epimerase